MKEWLYIKKGARQGCVLSLYLFNILAEMLKRQTLNGFQGRLQIGGWILTNLCYTDDIILLATLEAELEESHTNFIFGFADSVQVPQLFGIPFWYIQLFLAPP